MSRLPDCVWRDTRRAEGSEKSFRCHARVICIRYNSRCSPAVYGYSNQAGGIALQLLRAEESLEQVLAFWD